MSVFTGLLVLCALGAGIPLLIIQFGDIPFVKCTVSDFEVPRFFRVSHADGSLSLILTL